MNKEQMRAGVLGAMENYKKRMEEQGTGELPRLQSQTKKAKYLKHKEQNLQKKVLEYLRHLGVFCWKNNTTGIWNASRGTYIPNPAKGAPDIYAIHCGRLYGFEVKSPTGKVSPEQTTFGMCMTRAGAVWEVVRSLDDVKKYFPDDIG